VGAASGTLFVKPVSFFEDSLVFSSLPILSHLDVSDAYLHMTIIV
jgi:hypothetical protein